MQTRFYSFLFKALLANSEKWFGETRKKLNSIHIMEIRWDKMNVQSLIYSGTMSTNSTLDPMFILIQGITNSFKETCLKD